jgi:glycosyltransferase involved in cell wall biosynthesis
MVERVERVLMTTDCVGGVFTYTTTLARELCQRGVEVHVATMGPAMTAAQRRVLGSIPGTTLHESTFALEWMDEPWADVARAGDWLRVLEQDIRPDVVHLNGYAHASAGFRAPTVVVAHSCVLSWWRAVLGAEAPDRYATYRAEVGRGLRSASAVVAISRTFLEALELEHGPLANAVVVYNGAPPVALESVEKEPVVLAAGRIWDRAKNLEALARTAPVLRWPVRIAGWASEDVGAAQAIREANVEPLGLLAPEDLAREMSRAAVFALPAKYEPFGLGPLEAALHACALVLGDIDSLREIWGASALYVPPDDEGALGRVLDLLTGDPALRADLGVQARHRAERYSAARMADEMLAVYAQTSTPKLKGEQRRCA